MRKFLLASAAVLGVASAAQAQVTMQTAPSMLTGNAGGWGNTAPAPAPGQLVVRMNGAFLWYAGFTGDGDGNISYYTNSTGFPATASKFSSAANSIYVQAKLNQGVSFISYIRLYPGFDAVAANGLKYGVAAEIRQDVGTGNIGTQGTIFGRGGGGAFSSISGDNPYRSGLYWRRAYGYIGGDSWGTIRVGSGDGPSNLLSSGKMYTNGGGWNGDDPSFRMAGVGPSWPFMDVGNLYITNKFVYLTPQFYGFDAGFSYEPNTNALTQNNGCSLNFASAGCDRLSSISVFGGDNNPREQAKRMNTIEAFARYRGTFGGVGISAFGGYIGSGSVDTHNYLGNAGGWTPAINFDGLGFGLGGGQITYAGFSVGGLIQGGNYNRGYALKPAGAPNALAWLVGWTYTTGPIIFGAAYWQAEAAGSYVPGSQGSALSNQQFGVGNTQKERGLQVGATYAVAPGMSLYLSYLWGDRKQDGVNMLTGQAKTSAAACFPGSSQAGCYNNTTTAQIVSLGTVFKW